jgi:MoaA/NifB/PqqE/SkfB family radical SAM enzyme
MCRRNIYLRKGILNKKDVPLSLIEVAIEKVKNKIEFFNISAGYGEPLLHKDILQIIKKIKDSDLKVILFTNGTLLTEELSKKLLMSEVDIIIFSFEGYNQEEYESIRVGASYEKVLKNIKQLIVLKKKLGFPTKTILTSTITKDNYFQKINSLIELSKNLLVDKLEVRDTFFFNPFANKQKRIINIKNKKKLQHDFKFLIQKALALGLEISLPNIRIKKGVIFCPDPWRALYFRKDGYVRPCCINYKKVWSKNIFHDSLESIWNSKEMIEWRKRFLTKHPPKMCYGCPIGEVSEEF